VSRAGAGARRERLHPSLGFTLLEILVALSITGILAALATLRYLDYVERAKVARAAVEIAEIQTEVRIWSVDRNDEIPSSLAAAGITPPSDPWGRPYRYLKLVRRGPGNNIGQARKDRFLVPINSEFDLYSTGPDGLTRPPLQHKNSRDDVIRANDGSFIGLAERF
jgi:general secretion pathway protein G